MAEALLSVAMKSLSVLGHKKHALYQSIGKLMYAIVRMPFDITFCVDLLERYLAALTSQHLRIAEHTLAYMKHTSKMTLEYHRKSRLLSLKSYVDSDCEERKQQAGWFTYLMILL
jgi:hypothetical protein